jgi:hypothetical protein
MENLQIEDYSDHPDSDHDEVETVRPEDQTTIPDLESIQLPLHGLRSALMCVSGEETRYYLKGVYLHVRDGDFRMVATDGHRMFVFAVPVGLQKVPEWIEKGVIISADGLKERLALLHKLKFSTAQISYQLEAPRLLISDIGESVVYRVLPVDGTFPDYANILTQLSAFNPGEREAMHSVAYKPQYLKGLGDIAKMLGAQSIRIFSNGGDVEEDDKKRAEPTLITFPDAPEAVMVLMPQTHSTELGAPAARILAGPVKLSIAALTAHVTRNTEKLEKADRGEYKMTKGERKEIERKIEAWQKRVEALRENAELPALPPPADPEPLSWADYHHQVRVALAEAGYPMDDVPAPLKDWHEDGVSVMEAVARVIEGLTLPSVDLDEATAPEASGPTSDTPEAEQAIQEAPSASPEAVPTQSDDDRRHYRQKLSRSARKAARRRFVADINAALSASNAGFTVGELIEGAPIDDWFTGGLQPSEAAVRCAVWRQPTEQDAADQEQLEAAE